MTWTKQIAVSDVFIQVHTNTTTRAKMDQIFDPQFANVADYDCIIQATFKSVDDFVRFKADPEYLRIIAPDHENFADTKRSRRVEEMNRR